MTSASVRRAAAEVALLGFVLGVALLAVVPAQNVDAVWAALALGFVDIGFALGAIFAVRVHRSTDRSRRWTLGRELLVLALLVGSVAVAGYLAAAVAHAFRPALDVIIPPAWAEHTGGRPGILLASVAAGAGGATAAQAWILVRPVVLLWPRWDRLRRSRLVWSITHGQLVASLAIAVVVGIALLAQFLAGGGGPIGLDDPDLRDPLARAFVGFIVAVAGIGLVAVVAAVVVLPLGALVSHAVLRGTTRRLGGLTAATGMLRSGDLAARVDVEGDDEVARLQADFNAMATDLERSVGELEAERDTVGRLLTARRELLTAVSHELRTPVATLRGYLDSSLEHWRGGPPSTLRHDLEVMEHEATRLERLIEDLFDLSRAELDTLPLDLAPTELGPVLRRSVEALRPLAADRSRVELVDDVPAGLPAVLVDDGRLEQVVRNLVLNAVRHTPPGGVVRVSAEETTDPGPVAGDGAGSPVIAVRVEDTGEGIAAADLERIWERFYRTDGARDRDHGGAGLGLALVKELTEAMGGRVEAASRLGEGSRFSIYLPVAATGLRHAGDEAATTG